MEKIFCETCNKYYSKSNFKYNHIHTKKHKYNIEGKSTNKLNTEEGRQQHKEYQKLYREKNNKKVYCEFCDKEYSKLNYTTHLKNSTHIFNKQKKEFINTHGEEKWKEYFKDFKKIENVNRIHCEYCDKSYNNNTYKNHIMTEKHIRNKEWKEEAKK
jgi:hypothetical protein